MNGSEECGITIRLKITGLNAGKISAIIIV